MESLVRVLATTRLFNTCYRVFGVSKWIAAFLHLESRSDRIRYDQTVGPARWVKGPCCRSMPRSENVLWSNMSKSNDDRSCFSILSINFRSGNDVIMVVGCVTFAHKKRMMSYWLFVAFRLIVYSESICWLLYSFLQSDLQSWRSQVLANSFVRRLLSITF